jgi:hypothetical protein
MLYYRFGSPLKKKKFNYFTVMIAENIFELFMKENFSRTEKEWITEGIDWEIINRFQIRNIFWDVISTSETSNLRKYWWDRLTKLRAEEMFKSKKNRNPL